MPNDPTADDALLARLDEWPAGSFDMLSSATVGTMLTEAAARIRELLAENTRLSDERDTAFDTLIHQQEIAIAAGATISEMEIVQTKLRAITEDDVTAALVDANVALPITTPVEAVELVQCVVDHVTGERARVDGEDEVRVEKGGGTACGSNQAAISTPPCDRYTPSNECNSPFIGEAVCSASLLGSVAQR